MLSGTTAPSATPPPTRARVDLSRLTGSENLLLGLVSGMTTKSVNYPLLNWKNMVQQGLPISLNPAVFYRGLPMAVINLGGTTAVQFLLTGYFQHSLVQLAGKKSNLTTMGGAFMGGVLSGIPCSMYELTMVQQQRFGGSIVGTPIRLVRERGPGILTRGFVTTMGREGLYTFAMLGVTPLVQKTLVRQFKLDTDVGLGAGAAVGALLATTLTHPLDTIKTCMQGDVTRTKYQTMMQTGRQLVAESGLAKGLFRGLTVRIGLIGTTFFLVNKFKELYAPVLFPTKVTTDEES